MQKNPHQNKTTKSLFFGLLNGKWINERIATIINQIYKGKQIIQSAIMRAVCIIYKRMERLETVVRAGCLHDKSEYICAVTLLAEADFEKRHEYSGKGYEHTLFMAKKVLVVLS